MRSNGIACRGLCCSVNSFYNVAQRLILPMTRVIEVTALAVMTAGIIMLAHRAPAVARQRAEAETQAETTGSEAA